MSRIRFLLENDCGYGIDTFQGVFVDRLYCYKDMKLLSGSTETDVNTDRVVRQRWVCWAHVAESDPHDLWDCYYCHKQVAIVLEVVERQNHYNIYQNMDREERWGDWRIRLLTSMEVDIQRLEDRKNCATVAVAVLSYS